LIHERKKVLLDRLEEKGELGEKLGDMSSGGGSGREEGNGGRGTMQKLTVIFLRRRKGVEIASSREGRGSRGRELRSIFSLHTLS